MSGCTTIGRRRRPPRSISPASPPAWSKWPWLSTTAWTSSRSTPNRPALVTIAPGDNPVSKSNVVVDVPRRTVTSAAKPCSATSPTAVAPPRPGHHPGAKNNGGRRPPPPNRAQRREAVLGDQPDGRRPALELRCRHRPHAEGNPPGPVVVRKQRVERVVDQRGDRDL